MVIIKYIISVCNELNKKKFLGHIEMVSTEYHRQATGLQYLCEYITVALQVAA